VLADTGITSGHATLADLCFLVAVIVALVAAVIYFQTRALAAALAAVAVAALALGWFVL
jgi:hypothetical protein